MQLVGVACCVCGSLNHREFLQVVRRMDDGSGGTYRIAQCADCDFLYVNPRPAPEELIRLYSHHAMYFRSDYEPVSQEMPVLRGVIRDIQRFLKTGSILEIGCGRGELLELARENGFKVYGCDLQAPPHLGSNIEFHVGDLHSSGLSDGSFDCIVLRNTLEHLFDPASELAACNRLLKLGGFLYLKVPNADYEHGWRCRIMHGRPNVFGPPWHLNYFTPSTLERLLLQNGFALADWLIESPTSGQSAVRNAMQNTAVASFRTARLLSFGAVFPKPLLTCISRKTVSA